MNISIKPHYQSILLPLSKEAKAGLESSLIDDGCREPLVLWNDVLIDGHNRFDICQRRGIKFKTVSKEFADEAQVKDWILSNQMNRRNMTPAEAALIRGRLYEARKLKQGGDRKSESIRQSDGLISTAEAIAKEQGVSPRTVERDAEFALAVDTLATVDKDIVQRATRGVEDINGNVESVSRQDVIKAHQAWKDGDKAKAKKILKGATAHVSHNSGEQEWYTPPEYIVAARSVMGRIDLDPASSAIANRTVEAKRYFDSKANGLEQDWSGRVWLNPPYAARLIDSFVQKLLESDKVTMACVLTNNATDTGWGQSLISKADAICFVAGRIKFIDKSGHPSGAPLQGQMVCGLGVEVGKFRAAFAELGTVLKR